MRTLLTLGFGALIALAIVLWVALMAFSFLVISFLDFLSWMTHDGLPVTVVAALVALAIGAVVLTRRKGTDNVSIER